MGKEDFNFTLENEVTFLKHENSVLQKQVTCSSCGIGQKEMVLPKCGHLFCKECINKQISSRLRNCPIDRIRFTNNEPIRIYLNDQVDVDTNNNMV